MNTKNFCFFSSHYISQKPINVKGDDLLIVKQYQNSCHNAKVISHETENNFGIRTDRATAYKGVLM
jgi:hypothetical protein